MVRRAARRDAPEFLCLVEDGGAGVDGLHAKDLVVALLVVEHGRCKVVKHILGGERAMRLRRGECGRR